MLESRHWESQTSIFAVSVRLWVSPSSLWHFVGSPGLKAVSTLAGTNMSVS